MNILKLIIAMLVSMLIISCPRSEALTLKSSSFADNAKIPDKFTGLGSDVSPELKWSDVPPNTASFALVCYDTDAPSGTWVHWVVYNIPSSFTELPENFHKLDRGPDGTCQGVNDFGKVRYNGPNPPPGKVHRYYFKLFALNGKIEFSNRKNMSQLLETVKGMVLAEAVLCGNFGR